MSVSYLFNNAIISCAGDKIKKSEMVWACGAYGWGQGVYRVLVGKPEGKRPLGRPRRRWVGDIRMDIQEVGCGYMDWNRLAQDRRTLVSAVMNLRVPWNAGNFLTSCKLVSCSRRTLHRGVSKYNQLYMIFIFVTYFVRTTMCVYLIFYLRCIGFIKTRRKRIFLVTKWKLNT